MHSAASRMSEHIFMTTYNKMKATGEGWEDKISTDKIPNDLLVFCPDLLLAQFFGILSASSQHDLGFCPDHLEQKNIYFTFCAVLGTFLLVFFGFWELGDLCR